MKFFSADVVQIDIPHKRRKATKQNVHDNSSSPDVNFHSITENMSIISILKIKNREIEINKTSAVVSYNLHVLNQQNVPLQLPENKISQICKIAQSGPVTIY